MAENMVSSSSNRFEVDTEGMRSLHQDREPWDLIKELVQNAWDEAPRATFCSFSVRSESESEAFVVVEDDGPGFFDPKDSYTLHGDTRKRLDPQKRGRFNVGEKEVISVAAEAVVETVGHTIKFPREGGRNVSANDRERGTRVLLTMAWTEEQVASLVDRLKIFRPTDCSLIVDGEEVPMRRPVASKMCSLPTVVQDGPGEPMRDTQRRTELHILKIPADRKELGIGIGGESGGWLYEMGIPVQSISVGYDVDVQQKIPMPQRRRSVSPSYLKNVCAEVLNAVAWLMEPDEFKEPWARTAVENGKRVEPSVVKRYFDSRYGEDALIESYDSDSNMKAADAGRPLVSPLGMSLDELAQAKKAGMKSARDVYGSIAITEDSMDPSDLGDSKLEFAKWVKELAGKVGITNPSVAFVSDPESDVEACCTGRNREDPVLTFNVALLGDAFFDGRGESQLRLVVHELAHAWQEKNRRIMARHGGRRAVRSPRR